MRTYLVGGADPVFDDKLFKVRYTLKDSSDATGTKQADPTKVVMLTLPLTRLQARKWVKIDDADKLGLKDPQTVVTLYTRKEVPMARRAGRA